MNPVRSLKITCLLALISITFALGNIYAAALDDKPVILRVCVMDNKSSIYLTLKGAYKMYEINTDRIVAEGPRLRGTVKGVKGGLVIGKRELKIAGVRIKTNKDSDIYLDGRRFRGGIDIIKKDDLKLFAVNHIKLEDYLYGVLYHEVSHRWPMEVLKAQAIASRTYAVYQKRENKLQPYDLRSDIYSQVYGGRTSEKWATNRAVDLTKNKVLAYGGKILPAYFHATCAGYTEDASNLWKVDLAPLKGVACNFCKASPHYRWVKDIPLWKIGDALNNNGYKVGDIEGIDILSRNRSGRIDRLEIKDKAGVSVVLTGKDFRQIMGPNNIRSANFDVSVKWGKALLHGRGWGHGVGMCQWGAYGMARKGKSAEDILKYYYPGAEITTVDKLQ